MNYSAQGSITIKRLRNGSSVFLTINKSVDLYQGIDPESGVITPDWTQSANQPILTPVVQSTRGYAVALSQFAWAYNGLNINFSVDDQDGWFSDASATFKMNTSTGALKILKNLASLSNTGNDTLTFSCVASVAGADYVMTKDEIVNIQNMGASSYYGSILATTEQLTSDVTSAHLNTTLYLAASPLADYYVKWYKDVDLWAEKNGQKNITVTRDDVAGTQLFIAEFYKSSGDTVPVYRAGIRIIDTSDDFRIGFSITSSNVEVDAGLPVTVQAYIINVTKNETVTPSSPTWRLDVMDKNTWTVLRSVATNAVSISTTDTDRDGQLYDVDVTGEVTWS